MTGYTATIEKASNEFTKREAIMLKDTSDAIRIDQATESGEIVITPVDYAVLAIHNDKAVDDKDYKNYIILDKNGDKYVTGSESFFSTFENIWNEMDREEFQLKIYRKPSKNYSGKTFITCSIV